MLLSDEFEIERNELGPTKLTEENLTEQIFNQAPKLLKEKRATAFQLAVRWKLFTIQEKPESERISQASSTFQVEIWLEKSLIEVIQKGLAEASHRINLAEDLNREAEKYNSIKTAGIEWSEKIKPEYIVEYLRYKGRENETLKNLRLYKNLIQSQSNDEVVFPAESQKYRGIQGNFYFYLKATVNLLHF